MYIFLPWHPLWDPLLVVSILCFNFYLVFILCFPKVWTASRVELWSRKEANECNSQVQNGWAWDYCLVYCIKCDLVLTFSTHRVCALLCVQVIHCSSVREQTLPSFPASNRRRWKECACTWSVVQRWVVFASPLHKQQFLWCYTVMWSYTVWFQAQTGFKMVHKFFFSISQAFHTAVYSLWFVPHVWLHIRSTLQAGVWRQTTSRGSFSLWRLLFCSGGLPDTVCGLQNSQCRGVRPGRCRTEGS